MSAAPNIVQIFPRQTPKRRWHSNKNSRPDPIFAAIERSRRAEIACDAGEGPAAEAWASASALADTMPTTKAGLAALVSYLHEAQVGMCNAAPFFGEAEDALAFAANLSAAVNRELGFEPWKSEKFEDAT